MGDWLSKLSALIGLGGEKEKYLNANSLARKYEHGSLDEQELKERFDGVQATMSTESDDRVTITLQLPWEMVENGADLTVIHPPIKTGSIERFVVENFELGDGPGAQEGRGTDE